jgi:conjugal transfer pilus assembly protein TraV
MKTSKESARLPALALLCVLVPGCSWIGLGKSEFSCPGGSTDGVRCLSARQVYLATDNSDTVQPGSGAGPAEAGMPGVPAALPAAPSPVQGAVPVPSINQPMPIRTQAAVMRIWMAPWEDDDGDLHADGYLYTEVEGRRWNLGERADAPKPVRESRF